VEQAEMLGEIIVVRPKINEAAKPLDFGG
jgi:hypothetical protein